MRLQLIAFFALVCINFAIDFYIYFRIIRKTCRYVWLRISYWGINCLLLAAFLFAYALMKNHQDVDNRMVFIWFMFIYFLVYAPKITYFYFLYGIMCLACLGKRCSVYSIMQEL